MFFPLYIYLGNSTSITAPVLLCVIMLFICALLFIAVLLIMFYKKKSKAKQGNTTSDLEGKRETDHTYEDVRNLSSEPAMAVTSVTQNIAYGYISNQSVKCTSLAI